MLDNLANIPVLGVNLSNVSILRLDKLGGSAPGNKRFKLEQNLHKAKSLGLDHIVSFGGAWSNHIHALAAAGHEMGFRTTGIIRGDSGTTPSDMLVDAARWGMTLQYVSRQEYRQKATDSYLQTLKQQLGPCYLLPEGGANTEGVTGCEAIANLLPQSALSKGGKIVLACGTGTTLAGLARALPPTASVVGVSVLKNALDIDATVNRFTRGVGASWQVLHEHHQGGYAKVSATLKQFMVAFESAHHIPLDPVYTGKALLAVHQLQASGEWQSDNPLIFVHTGGLQGRRGFSWLS